MSLLHVLDMDGTLLRDTTASLEIAKRLGCLPELIALEAAFGAGALDTRGFAAEICALWQDLTREVVAEAFTEAPWISGLADVLADIRRRGERSIVITMSPDFFAAHLEADEVFASAFPALPFGGAIADPAGILTPDDKVKIVDRVRAEYGLTRDQCVAYGDSGSDLPLFDALHFTVAVNASAGLRALALLEYDGDDFREAYRQAREAVAR